MAKDPAFLFYHHDFLVGTAFMSHQEVGQYIRILCHMADKGRLTKKRMIDVCGTSDLDTSLIEKFKIDENGLYFNERLEVEVSKRKNFCESRRLSRMSNVRETYVERMVNRNRDVNEVKNTIPKNTLYDFEPLWAKYPNKDGKKDALRHFNTTVKTDQDYQDIQMALNNYLNSERVFNGFIKNGSTWFNNWRDWVDFKEEVCQKCKGKGKFISATGYEILCDCPKGKNP